jgi:predicted HTH transcriptional regulator
MTLQEVKRLAAQGEGLRLEFKKKVAFPEKIVRELIALANTEGGKLLLGVDDDGTVSGQRFIEEEVFVLKRAIQDYILPSIDYEVDMIKINEKKGVAIFDIPKSNGTAHYLMDGNRKKAYIRVEDRSVQASREVWEILKRRHHQRDIVFTYGPKEEKLMRILGENGKVTLREYIREAKLPKFLASKTLVRLVLANVLEIHPEESEDYFTLKE